MIETKLGLDTEHIKAVAIEYLGNGEYVVEGENCNRYIREVVRHKCLAKSTKQVIMPLRADGQLFLTTSWQYHAKRMQDFDREKQRRYGQTFQFEIQSVLG